MRYIIYGAGAIGGTIGARLHAAGKEVVLICRGEQLTAVRRDGLLLRTPDGEVRAECEAVGSPDEISFRERDVVVLGMKTQDTSAALDALEIAAGDVPVICAQNGVANERMAARRFSRVYAMNVLGLTAFIQPGEVIAYGTPISGVLDAGRFPSGTDFLIDEVAGDFSASSLLSRPTGDVMRLKYAKLLVNLGNALDAILGVAPAGGGDVGRRLREEAIACYRAASIDWADDAEVRERVSVHYKSAEVPDRPRLGGSTRQSLEKGHRRLEVDYLNGEICLLGTLYGIPTPANAAVRRLVQLMAARGERPGSHTMDEIEALIGGAKA